MPAYFEHNAHATDRACQHPRESATPLDPADQAAREPQPGPAHRPFSWLTLVPTLASRLRAPPALHTLPCLGARGFVRQNGPAPTRSPNLAVAPAVSPERSICSDPVGSSSFGAAARSFRLLAS